MGTYSDGVSNDPCESCPANSEATETGLAECPCIQNYYRAPDETADLPCASELYSRPMYGLSTCTVDSVESIQVLCKVYECVYEITQVEAHNMTT